MPRPIRTRLKKNKTKTKQKKKKPQSSTPSIIAARATTTRPSPLGQNDRKSLQNNRKKKGHDCNPFLETAISIRKLEDFGTLWKCESLLSLSNLKNGYCFSSVFLNRHQGLYVTFLYTPPPPLSLSLSFIPLFFFF